MKSKNVGCALTVEGIGSSLLLLPGSLSCHERHCPSFGTSSDPITFVQKLRAGNYLGSRDWVLGHGGTEKEVHL